MNRSLIRILFFTLVGAVALLALQWHFSYAWTSYYSRFPWQGYEQAMREGHVPAFLTTSSRSSLVGRHASSSEARLDSAGARPIFRDIAF